MVKALVLDVTTEAVSANLTVTTLEDTVFQIKWTVENGLEIEKVDGQNVTLKESFEDLNQLLQNKSKKYQEKFSEQLNNKLFAMLG